MNNIKKLPDNCIELPDKLGFLRIPNSFGLLNDFAETYCSFKDGNIKEDIYFQARSSLIEMTQYFYPKDREKLFDESVAGILCTRDNIQVLSGFTNAQRAKIHYLAISEITGKVLVMVLNQEDTGSTSTTKA
ncbi:MAG: hypothetical protein JJW01_02370 [Alphaproteobacteria bacterium]|nr:hypothetical protein [Rickettsiales bacterium]